MSEADRLDEGQPGSRDTSESSFTIPVVEERVGKPEAVTDHVVLRKTFEERDVFVVVLRQTRDVSVERDPVNRVVEEAPTVREDGDVVIVPVIEEGGRAAPPGSCGRDPHRPRARGARECAATSRGDRDHPAARFNRKRRVRIWP